MIPEKFLNRVRKNFDLSKTNWFQVGGRAEYLFKPENGEDLSEFLAALPQEIPITVLGVGSNIIIRDGGIDGIVVKLGRAFACIGIWNPESEKEHVKTPDSRFRSLTVGSAALDLNVAHFAAENSISGLEFLSGIPGTIGGAVKMNAGAYGADISQALVSAEIVERNGKIRTLNTSELGFSYRKSTLPEGAIVTKAILQGKAGNSEEIWQKISEIKKSREDSQPIRERTGGSTFKNPKGHKAWELIDRAGCRGLRVGGAQMSEKHCNFMINTGGATATDLENLGEEVIRRVQEKTGLLLEWEIKRIGKKSS